MQNLNVAGRHQEMKRNETLYIVTFPLAEVLFRSRLHDMPVRNEYGMNEYRISLASTRYPLENDLNTVRNEYTARRLD